ncbi:MAG: AsmA-like C-terminal region-containing protein [Gammaproteobacteria bacterium]|nr:AsmA-like C-terminal region-containing protein [Gammaproteobacteria bacterium]
MLSIGLLGTAKISPQLLVSGANKIQDAFQIQAESVRVDFVPLKVNVSGLVVRSAQVDILADRFSARAEWLGWWQEQPFWSVSAGKLAVNTRAVGELTQGAAVETQVQSTANANSTAGTPLAMLFVDIDVDEFILDDQYMASFHAQRNDRGGISLKSAGRQMSQVAAEKLTWSITAELLAEETAQAALFPLALTFDGAVLIGATSTELDLKAQLTFDNTLAMIIKRARVDVTVGGATEQPAPGGNVLVENTIFVESTTIDGGEIAFGGLASGGFDVIDITDLRGLHEMPGAPGYPFVVNGRFENLSERPKMDLALTFAGSELQARGQFDPNNQSGEAQLNLISTSLPHFVPIFPYHDKQVFPLEVSVALRLDDDTHVDSFSLNSPGNVATGSAFFAMKPLRLIADVSADRLFIPLISGDLDAAEGEEEREEGEGEGEGAKQKQDGSAEDGVLFSDVPLPLDWLADAAIDISLQAKMLSLQQAQFQDFLFRIEAAEGELRVSPISGSIGEGGFDGEFSLAMDTRVGGTQVVSRFDFSMQGVRLEQFGFLPSEELSGGDVFAEISLQSTGLTPHKMVSSMQGEVLLMVEAAQLRNDLVELVGSDVLLEMANKLNPFTKEDPTTELECGLAKFAIEAGLMTSDKQLVVDTTKMEIIGDGKINLSEETLDITFSPSAKSGVGVNVGSLVKFIKLGGDLRHPTPQVDALGILQSGAAVGAALSTGGISLVAEGLAKRALNAGSACDDVRGET